MAKNNNGQAYVNKNFKQRMLITVGLIVCGFSIVIVSLANISLVNHDKYSSMASGQQLRDTVVSAPRGTIYDANMNVLAQSATVWTVALSPMDIEEEDFDTIARGLSEILEMDYQTIYDKCFDKTYYSIVKRKVDQPVVDRIRQFMIDEKVGGISFTEDSKRYYPYGNFLAQALGFVGTDNQGLSGLEAYYNEELSGTSGRILTAKNAVGGDMYYEYETRYEPESGNSLVLTVDEVIQHYLEKNLEAAVKEHHVQKQAAGIVMNVKTGEILAMAVKPDFDPNEPLTLFDEALAAQVEAFAGTDEYNTKLGLAQQFQWRNKAISDTYEPGSVFKVVTASTALETGACTLESTFYCNGSVKVGPHIMHCASSGHGQETFVNAVINSCNPAFIDIGQRIGAGNFSKYFRAFGLTEKTGIDLPGEASSIYVPESSMGIVELSSCAYGQSNSITPIQLITAVSAAVNGGYLVQPHMVKQIIDSDGNIVRSFDTEVKRQVISAETSKLMAEIMEQVVLHANGQNSYVAGFRIGGKSGTSQKLNLLAETGKKE
ncbi:MAG: penicillin-binding transpeptidase domain-containing protein, partial [Oscillospiraceae bacterium]